MEINERIFIAGSNGMVGSAIKNLLNKKGYGNSKFGGELLCPCRKELNLLNFDEVKKWFKNNQPSIVILAAAKVGGISANSTKPYEFIYENLNIQTNVIEASRLTGVKKLLFLGSSCIYPKYSKQPIKEEYLLTSELEQTNQWYALAKIAGIKLCEALNLQYGFDAISLMPCNLYGIGDNYDPISSHVIPALIHKFYTAKKKNQSKVVCWGTGNPLREFLYVDDLAEACIFALNNFSLTKDDSLKKTSWLNVGSGNEISIKRLSEIIVELVGYEGKVVWDDKMPDGTPRKILDSSKMKSLGWEPKIKLKKGLKLAIKDYVKNKYRD